MGIGSGVCVRRGADGNGSVANEFSPSPIRNTFVIPFPRWFSPKCQWGYFALRFRLGGISGGLWLVGSTLVFLQFININCSSTVAYCNRKGGDRASVVEQELVDHNIDLTVFQPPGYLFHNA
jgi:hypothetical protein